MNDPREMVFRPESGVTFEQDNRVETMYQWGARIVDLCDLPVSEYMKPMTVIVYGNGGEWEPEDPTLKTENVKIWFRILKNGNDVNGEEQILSAGEDGETIWTACWEWIGSFSNEVKVAAVVQTNSNSYTVSAVLKDNEAKKHEETIVEITPEESVESYKSYGVASTETPAEEVTATTYTEVVESTKVKFEVSSAETIVYLTLKLNGVNSYTNSEMRYGDEIPFSEVNIDKEGYEFTHWVDSKGNRFDGTKMPAYDLTLTAKYEAKKCVVDFVFILDGEEETVSSMTVNYGTKISKFPSTSKEGYVFKGWEPSKDTVITDDTTFIGYFESIEYVVVWSGYSTVDYPNGVIEQTYKYNEPLIQPINPEKEGYSFVRWDKNIPTTVKSNLKFNAIFTINSYKISFNKEWNGVIEEISSYTKNYGAAITLPNVPTEEGYTYTSWQSDYTGTTVPSHDVVYTTVKTVNSYIISYYADSIKVNEAAYDYMEEITPYVYLKEGYTVSDWSPELPDRMPAKNLSTFCETSVNKYELIFIDNNGNEYKVMAEYGTTIGDNVPEIEGKTFIIPEEIAESLVGVENPNINGEIVINNYKVNITIDGEVIDVTELPYGTNVNDYINENFPAEEGYTIIIDSNYEYVPADDSLVVNVSYKANVWVLTYSTVGSENDLNGTVNVEYGANVTDYLPETEQVGYEFNGWFVDGAKVDDSYTMPNKDITVNGEYNIEMYNVSVVDGNIVLINKAYEYKTPISSVLNEQEIVNYVNNLPGYNVRFEVNGDNLDENLIVTEDLVINIEKTAKEFTLIFKNGDEIISSNDIAYGTTIEYPVMNDKVDENGVEYVFVWEGKSYNGEPMPAQNLIITGSYQEKSIGEIYFGSFFIPKEDASRDNLVQYFNENDLHNGVYNSVKVNECVGVYKPFTLVVPIYEPFKEMPDFVVDEERNNYYAPLTLIIPVDVANKYDVSIKDDMVDYWEDYITDKEVINVNGVDCYFFVRYSDNVTPYFKEQYLDFYLKLTEKKQYNITFFNGEEVILKESKYEGETIKYPVVENKEEGGNTYVFVWDDETLNGAPMPSYDVEINGSYQIKGKDPIYFGSFVVEKSEASTNDLNQYFDESQLDTNAYGLIDVDSCIDKSYDFTYIIPIYEPFKEVPDFVVDEMRNEYYAPLTLIIPKDIYDNYTPSIVDEIGVDYWEDYIKEDELIKINGSEFILCVRYSDNVTPYFKEQYPGFKIKLTKK